MPYSLYDYRDLDLMLKIADVGDDEGWIETRQLAESLGVPDDEKSNGVGVRLAWMRKFGMLERDDERKLWRLSRGGERVADARVRAAAVKQIDSVPEEALIDVMAHVTARYRLGDQMMATMLRREFRYGTSPNSQIWRRT